MRKFVFTFLTIFAIITANAQTIVQKRAYIYNEFVPLDSDCKPGARKYVAGAIVFSEAEGVEFISVTTGEDVTYNGPVRRKKKEQNGNDVSYIYMFTTEFQGYEVPLQMFEVYDLSISSIVPIHFMVMVHSALTGEYIQGQSYEGISRIK